MAFTRNVRRFLFATAASLAANATHLYAVEGRSPEQRLNDLETQNQLLREELAAQKKLIEELRGQGVSTNSSADLTLEELLAKPACVLPSLPDRDSKFQLGRLHISGEGGVAYFHTGSAGAFPEGAFRVDEAKLFLEAPLWESTYIFAELDLVTREANDEFFHLGELYIDFENVLRHWTEQNFLSVRAGRMDIPFGEEYLVRDVIDNPLISHSLSDFWGIDEGVELYGSALGFDYVVAVQNGGHPTLQDFDSDKSVAGRIGYNFGSLARLSFSGIRTGDLSSDGDELSELWFGNGFFRSLEPAAETFSATVYEIDAQTFWKTGHLKLAAGVFEYDDSAPDDRSRDGHYYYAEVLQHIVPKFYTAARFSHILADDGMPLIGHGDAGEYFFSPFAPLTEDLWRLSIAFGYRWSENLLAKIEYTVERGETVDGLDRDQHDFFGAELGFKF